MDAFITKTKRKASPSLDAEESASSARNALDDESTEVKLAILASLHPDVSQEALLDVLLAHSGSVPEASASLDFPSDGTYHNSANANRTASIVGSQMSLRSFAPLRTKDGERFSPKKAKLLSRKGATLHLFDPADIAEHTPCSIIHNFLPPELANELLMEMLEESKSFEKITFKLFDNVVMSPHTSSFYVESYDEMQQQKTDVGTDSNSKPLGGCAFS